MHAENEVVRQRALVADRAEPAPPRVPCFDSVLHEKPQVERLQVAGAVLADYRRLDQSSKFRSQVKSISNEVLEAGIMSCVRT